MVYEFKTTNQNIACTNATSIISDSINFVEAKFVFDSDWNGLYKIVQFQNTTKKVYKEVVLDVDQDTCYIPWEVIEDDGKLVIYAEGTKTLDDLQVRATTKMSKPITINASDKVLNSSMGQAPTPELYEQIFNKINQITAGMVDEEAVNAKVDAYLLANPPTVDLTDVNEAISQLNHTIVD